MRLRRLLVLIAVLVGSQAGVAAASSAPNACVLSNAQASSVLGSTATHGKSTSVAAVHEEMCTYTGSGGSRAIAITESPAAGYPSVSLLKMMMKGATITTLQGIGSKAELAKLKSGIVSLYFVAGASYCSLVLSNGHQAVSAKQVTLLEAAAKAAAKKL